MPESEEKRETLQNTAEDTQKKRSKEKLPAEKFSGEKLLRFWREKLTLRKKLLLAAALVLVPGCLFAKGSGIKAETAQASPPRSTAIPPRTVPSMNSALTSASI